MYRKLFNRSQAEGHLGGFQCLAIMNKASTGFHVQIFELWFSQGICPVVRLLGHMVVLF